MFVWQKKEAQRYNAYRHTPPKTNFISKAKSKSKSDRSTNTQQLKIAITFLVVNVVWIVNCEWETVCAILLISKNRRITATYAIHRVVFVVLF
jgi:hypothetical protein